MQLSFVEGRNRMKLCNKISKGVAKGAEVICMLTIAALVLVIVVELLRRNFLGLWRERAAVRHPLPVDGLYRPDPPVPGQRPDAPGLPCRPHQGPGVRGAVLRQQAVQPVAGRGDGRRLRRPVSLCQHPHLFHLPYPGALYAPPPCWGACLWGIPWWSSARRWSAASTLSC